MQDQAKVVEVVEVPTRGGLFYTVPFCRDPELTRDKVPETIEPIDVGGHPTVPHQFRNPDLFTSKETETPGSTFDSFLERVRRAGDGFSFAVRGDGPTLRTSPTLVMYSAPAS